MQKEKTIALVAHDNRKADLIHWAAKNYQKLQHLNMVCTGTTGRLIHEMFKEKLGESVPVNIKRLMSGPLGGDQQLGALISQGEVDVMVFFWDPMEQQPHDVDIKALLRIAVLYNVPNACNRSTADFLISSPLFDEDYAPEVKDYSSYLNRKL